MDNKMLIALSQSSIFKGIDILELKKILSPYIPIIKCYQKGETIKNQGEVIDRLIVVLNGRLKAVMDSEDGKSVGMEEFTSHMSVAIPILFSPNQILPVSLYAIEDSELFCMDRDSLINCGMNNRQIFENILANMSERVSFLSKKINFLQLSTIKQKIAYLLIKRSKETDSNIFKLPGTKEKMSKEMGVTRPSLSREFSNLVQRGIISQKKGFITILKMDELISYK